MVSIIIPNYNHAKFLKQRIDSVLKQTYQNFEVIILDDNSTDNSKTVIEEYRNHPKISSIQYNAINSGSTFLQWKKGIELAKGEWIWIAESDDWCEYSLLEELVTGINKYSGCVLSYCQSLMIEKNKILLRSGTENFQENIEGRIFVKNQMLQGNAIYNASMCIFRKSEYYIISQEFSKYKFSGDWLFWIEIALKGNVYISGKTLNYFRKHENDVSSFAYSDGLAYLEFLKLINYLRQQNIISQSTANLLFYKKARYLLDDKRIDIINKRRVMNTLKKNNSYLYHKALFMKALAIVKLSLKLRYLWKRVTKLNFNNDD